MITNQDPVFIQVDNPTQLPSDIPGTASTIPRLIFAWCENSAFPQPAGLYANICTAGFSHSWVFVGPGGGGPPPTLLPDVKFVVARQGYGGGTLGDSVPGTTYTSGTPSVALITAIAAAAVYTDATMRVVILHGDTYDLGFNTLNIPANVCLLGLGPKGSVRITNGSVDFQNGCYTSNITYDLNEFKVSSTSSACSIQHCDVRAANIEFNITNNAEHFISNSSFEATSGPLSFDMNSGGTLRSADNVFLHSGGGQLQIRSTVVRPTVFMDNDWIRSVSGSTPNMALYNATVQCNGCKFGWVLDPAKQQHITCDLSQLRLLDCLIDGSDLPSGTTGDVVRTFFPPSNLSISEVRVRPRSLRFSNLSSGLVIDVLESERGNRTNVISASSGSGLVTVTLGSGPNQYDNYSADVFFVLANYSSTPSPSNHICLELPSPEYFPPGRKFVVKNSHASNGPLAIVRNVSDTWSIDGLPCPPSAPISGLTHVTLGPGSSVTLLVDDTRTNFVVID